MCFFHLLSQHGVPLLFSAKKGSGLARHVSWDENNYPLVVQPSYYWFQVGFHVFFLTRHPRWLLMNLSHDFPPKFLFGLANGRCKWEKSETINITRQDLWQHSWSESFFLKEKKILSGTNEWTVQQLRYKLRSWPEKDEWWSFLSLVFPPKIPS